MADAVHQQGENDGEDHHDGAVPGHAQQHADAHAGEGGVAQGVGKEGHAVIDHHGAQKGEQGHDEQHREQGAAHKIVLPPAEKRVHIVPRFVDSSAARPGGGFYLCPGKASRKAGEAKTSAGVPTAFTEVSSSSTRSALRRT